MGQLEFLFAFYSVLLGLALSNLANGAADIWDERDHTTVGVLVPAAGATLFFGIVGYWYFAWIGRDYLKMTPGVLFSQTAIALPLVFATRAIFPKRIEQWRALDDYYLAQRRPIMGVFVLLPLVTIVTALLVYDTPWNSGFVVRIVLALLPLGAMFSERRWVHLLVLGLLSLFYLLRMLVVT